MISGYMYVFMNIHENFIHLFMFECMQKYVYLYTCFSVCQYVSDESLLDLGMKGASVVVNSTQDCFHSSD